MRETEDIHSTLKERLETNLKNSIKPGSMLDMMAYSYADESRAMYQEIEDAKNPHLFTNTWGTDLDSLGAWVNLSRQDGEDDNTYKYRLKEWVFSAEASNTKAISNSLLNLEYASNIDYVPYTHGCGTGTCYVIPKTYDETVITAALEEAAERIKEIVSPSLYVEYFVPTIRGVRLNCFITYTDVDERMVQNTITDKVRDYINAIPPGEFLKVGDILRIGLNVSGVEYFNVINLVVDEETITDLELVQELETKFIFDEIVWSGEQ